MYHILHFAELIRACLRNSFKNSQKCLLCTMCQLSSKLRRKENNTDVLQDQIYLQKIIWKYLEIRDTIDQIFSKKSPLALTSDNKRLRNLLQVFSIVSLFKLVNAVVNLDFRSYLVLPRLLLVSFYLGSTH